MIIFQRTMVVRVVLLFCLFVVGAVSQGESADLRKELVRFVDNKDGTITDTKTGMMWAAKDNANNLDFDGAVKYCQSFKSGDHTDWRLPTRNELSLLHESGVMQNDNQHGVFTNLSGKTVWAFNNDQSSKQGGSSLKDSLAAQGSFSLEDGRWISGLDILLTYRVYNIPVLPVRSVNVKF